MDIRHHNEYHLPVVIILMSVILLLINQQTFYRKQCEWFPMVTYGYASQIIRQFVKEAIGDCLTYLYSRILRTQWTKTN